MTAAHSVRADRQMAGPITTPLYSDLIYDIGMHKGEDTEFYLGKGFRVVGIEADPDLAQTCRNRLKTFIDQRRLTIVEGAIVEPTAIEAGQTTVRFYKNEGVSVWGTMCSNWAERNVRLGTSSKAIEVTAIDLADVIQEHGIPHYMKIDIEGQDMVCIRAVKNFQNRPDYVSLESDKTGFQNVKREIDALVELGYDGFQAVEQSTIHLTRSPPLPAREGKYVAHRFEPGSSGLFGAELDDEWKSKDEIIRQYLPIWLGHCLLGDDGVMNRWKFPGTRIARGLVRRFLQLFTRAPVPGWYDTHARRSCYRPDLQLPSARSAAG